MGLAAHPGHRMDSDEGPRVGDSRDGRHVVVELGQEAREGEWLVHANDVLQILSCVSREGDPSLPGDKT